MFTSIPTAVAGVAALALAGSVLTGGTAAHAQDGKGGGVPTPAKRVQVSSCTGGAALSMSSRTMDIQSVAGGTTVQVEGSQLQLKGPKKGTDTVLVTFSSLAAAGGAGELTTMSLYRDGVGTSDGPKYYAYGADLVQATIQFCTKIGKGQHTLELRAADGSGGSSTFYYPTVTYQRFN